jgi:hypothetical protein
MKHFTRFICLALALAMLFVVPVNASANTPEITPYSSSFFHGYSAYLSRYSSTLFYICYDVTACGIMTELGFSSVELQRSSNGSNWTTVKTYTPDEYPDLIRTNAFSHSGSKFYAGTAGYYYRACVTLYAKNSTGMAKCFAYTDVLKL